VFTCVDWSEEMTKMCSDRAKNLSFLFDRACAV